MLRWAEKITTGQPGTGGGQESWGAAQQKTPKKKQNQNSQGDYREKNRLNQQKTNKRGKKGE